MKEEKFVESPLMREMYEKFIDEFNSLLHKYISNIIQINIINANDFVAFIHLASIGSSCCLLVLLEKMTEMSFDDIINNVIPASNEKLIETIKEMKNIETCANQ